MKTFNKLLTVALFLFSADAFSATPQSHTVIGTRFLPSIDISFDKKDFSKEDRKKDLTILYVTGSSIKKSNGFFVENVISERSYPLASFDEPGVIKVPASESTVTATSLSELRKTLETPYNYIVFALHKPGKFYWVNPATRNNPHPTPLYYKKQLSEDVLFEIFMGAKKSKAGDVKTYEIIIDDVENKLCTSTPPSPCKATRVNLKDIPFKTRLR